LNVEVRTDQSIFVRTAIQGVLREVLIAAGLTGLLFLGSWRSPLIVCISIRLSILASLSILSLLGQSIPEVCTWLNQRQPSDLPPWSSSWRSPS
jgi:multidrug efflux pump subunit AcrB